jgi:hypothetical protein
MSFFRDLFYAVAAGAIIGRTIRQRRERREAQARAAMRAPPVIGPPPLPRPKRRGQRVAPSGLPLTRRWR